jgi:hypothetical protein
MRSFIDQALRSAYAVSERKLLLVNAVLAVFVAVSNGGALTIAASQGAPELPEIRAQAVLSLPLSALVLAAAVAAWINWVRPFRALAIHSVALGVSAVGLMLWATKLLSTGVPESNFVWMPGILTAWAAYAAVLGGRFLVRDRSHTYYLPVLVLLIAGVLDIGVLARAI